MKLYWTLPSVAAMVLVHSLVAMAAPPTVAAVSKIIDNGPDGTKLNVAVFGDGYAAADQAKFNLDVDELMICGVFSHDFFSTNRSAFNVYRVNLISAQSGVSQRVYDEHNTPFDPSDDTVVSTSTRDTALKFIWSGSWAHCWLERSADTDTLLNDAIGKYVPTYNYVLVILNQDSHGGCGGNNQQVVPRGITWDVLAHEYGHGIGGLFDEYFNPGTMYDGAPILGPNISTVLDRNQVSWHDLIRSTTQVVTHPGPGIDSNQTVGEFEGGGTVERGIYRPVDNCRMRSNSPPYCPVCERVLHGIISPYLMRPLPPVGAAAPRQTMAADLHLLVPEELRAGTKRPGEKALVRVHTIAANDQRAALQGGSDRSSNNAGSEKAETANAGTEPSVNAYVQLILRVDKSGKANVVSAVEVPGKAIVSQAKSGNWIYEVTNKENKTVLVHSLPDPFESRSFSSPPNAGNREGFPEGHHTSDRKEANVVVRLPNTTIDKAIADDYAIKCYAIKPGLQTVHRIDVRSMAVLKDEHRVEVRNEITSNKLAAQLRQLGRKLDAPQ
jgi:hypothetical protein